MHKLIMLRGNSGSGKTTVAKELQERFGRGTMVLSQDILLQTGIGNCLKQQSLGPMRCVSGGKKRIIWI